MLHLVTELWRCTALHTALQSNPAQLLLYRPHGLLCISLGAREAMRAAGS